MSLLCILDSDVFAVETNFALFKINGTSTHSILWRELEYRGYFDSIDLYTKRPYTQSVCLSL